ncbi:MAG: hypothetical protein AAB368_07995 [bacterium]
MADELTELMIRGVQQGQEQALREERIQIQRDTQTRLTQAMAERAAQAAAKAPKPIPPDLVARLVNPDATPEDFAAAFAEAGSRDLDTTKVLGQIGSRGRKQIADSEAEVLDAETLRAMIESNPDAARGLAPGMPMKSATNIYNQASQNRRDVTGPPGAAGKGPPLSQEDKDQALIDRTLKLRDDADARAALKKEPPVYWKGYVNEESKVPQAVADELATRAYGTTVDALGLEEEIQDGPAKGMSGKEVTRHLLGLGARVQKLARGGTPLQDAIAQVETEATPKPGPKGRFGRPGKPRFEAASAAPPPPVAPPTTTPGNAALDAIIQQSGGDRAKIRDMIRARGIKVTPADVQYLKSKLGG